MPLYDSLGENAVEFIINHSESSILFVAKDKLSTVIQALPKAHKGLKTLVYWGTHDERHPEADEVFSQWLSMTAQLLVTLDMMQRL